VMDTPADVFLNVFDIYAETEMGPWLHEIMTPAMVLTGELDGGCNPCLNSQMAKAMPNAELVILEGLKHAIFIEATERVLPHVRRFLLAQ
jgi:3-oxoadipate enol-lactonase